MKIYSAILISLLMLSCTSNKSTNEIQILFEASNELRDFDTKFKILKVPSEILIGTIEQIESDDIYIYIFSSCSDESAVYLFDRYTGKYVKSIGHFGRGSEEYLSPSSISLNNGILSIVDEEQSVILNYNVNTLSFLNKIKSPNIGGFIVNNGIIYANPYKTNGHHAKNAFASLNDTFDIINQYIKLPIVSGYIIGPSKPIYLNGDSVRAYTQLMPYVYELTPDSSHIIYSLSFDGLKFPEQSYLKRIAAGNKDYTIPLFKSDYISYFDVFETDDNLLSMCIANNKRYLGIYDKITNKGYLISEHQLNQISPAQPFLISGVMDDKFVIAVSKSDMTESTLSIDMKSIIEQADENDIILQLVALK